MDAISWTVGAALLALNLVVTAKLFDEADIEPQSRAWQLLAVWLLPLVGAIVVMAAHRLLAAEFASGSDIGTDGEDASGNSPEMALAAAIDGAADGGADGGD